MKSICLLLIIILLSFTKNATISNTENKKAEKLEKLEKSNEAGTIFHNTGSGSWNSGYHLDSGCWIQKGKGNFNNEGTATLLPKNIEKPSGTDEKQGLCLSWKTGPGPNFQKAMTRVGKSNRFCLPYRYIGDVSYTNPSLPFKNKYITCSVTTDSKEQYTIRLLLPYAFLKTYITDKEGLKLRDLIKKRRDQLKDKIRAAKLKSSKCCSEFIANQNMLDSIKKKGSQLKKDKAKLKKDIADKKANQKRERDQQASIEKEMHKLEAKLKALQLKQQSHQTNVTNLSHQIESSEKAYKKLQGGKSKKLEASCKANISKASKCFNAEMNRLTSAVPDRKADLTKARNFCMKSRKFNDYQSRVDGISPLN